MEVQIKIIMELEVICLTYVLNNMDILMAILLLKKF